MRNSSPESNELQSLELYRLLFSPSDSDINDFSQIYLI